MRLLIDTHVALWWFGASPRLSPAVVDALTDPGNEVFVSVATVWEVAIKESLGKLRLGREFREEVKINRFAELPVSGEHAAAVRDLPFLHRDPFDRLLVAQARCDGLTVATADSQIEKYDVRVLRAA